MAGWDTELRAVLKKHLDNESSVSVVIAMYRGVRTAPRLMAGNADEDTMSDGAFALLEHAFVLTGNPFMAVFGAQMMTVYQMAIGAYTDSFHYFGEVDKQSSPEARADMLLTQKVCQMAVHEITLMAVLCERGFGYHRANAINIREDLYALKGVI